MAIPPSARGRKNRLVREGESPHDLVLVVRATPADRDRALAAMIEDADLSARQYVVEAEPGSREVLYGVSVFARRPGVEVATIVDRFMGAAAYVEVPIGALRSAGFEVYPTGANPDHFDIQLIGGVSENDPAAPATELREAAARALAVAGPLKPKPAYAGGTAESPQEDR